MAKDIRIKESPLPLSGAPGKKPSQEDLEQAEAYFRHHEGVYIADAEWDPEDLTRVVPADTSSTR